MQHKVFITVLFFFFYQQIASAQVACIDSFPPSLFQNPSFEDHGACNMAWRGEGGLIDGNSSAVIIPVPFWHAVNESQSPRYYNLDCRIPGLSLFDDGYLNSNTGYPGIPNPLPDGKGLISVEQYNQFESGPDVPENRTKKVYITACLPAPLKAGTTYYFDFQFGFGKFNPNFTTVSGLWGSPSPFNLGIFGRVDCPDFPLSLSTPDSTLGCLEDRGNWISLGKTQLKGRSQWVEGYIEFTPSQDISALAVGPSCSNNFNIADTFAIYYMDKFILAPKIDFAFKDITVKSGDACTGNFVLQAPLYPNASYQWYKDNLPLMGAASQIYAVPTGAAGYYMANISMPGVCFNSLPYPVYFSPIKNFTLVGDTVGCLPNTVLLNAAWPGAEQYLWQDGSTNTVFNVVNSGNYSVQLKDAYGCTQKRSVHVSIENCNACKLYMPNAFTPNNDGINDLFKPLPGCHTLSLEHYRMSIYNNFGQAVFQSSDPSAGWAGSFNNKAAPQGVYVYTVDYNFSQNAPVRLSGTVMLLR